MKHTEIARDIRDSLEKQHCYLNTPDMGRLRVFGAKAKRDGSLSVRVQIHTPNQVGHGRIAWFKLRPGKDSVTLYACTAMEETYAATAGGLTI